MKKRSFFALYFGLPVIPAFFYIWRSGSGFDSYSVSVALGVFVFCMVCNQFMLASRPRFAVVALGQAGLLRLHRIMPAVIIVLAFAHRTLKALNGFVFSSVQALLGIAAWLLFIAIALAAFAFMNGSSAFRDKIFAWTGLSYKKIRSFHALAALAGVIVMVHMLLATSSSFSRNPAGTVILLVWMGVALGMYVDYRRRGRKAGV
jgi:predicted ferric reductase